MVVYIAITLDWENALESLLVSLTFGEEGYIGFLLTSVVSEFVLGVIYFGYMPYKMNGQTLGKKILRIKAVDEYGDNLTFAKHCMRAIQNWSVYVSIPLLLLLLVNQNTFVITFGLIGNLVNMLLFVSLILIFAKEDGRGLHDMVTGSMVVSINEDFNQEFAMKAAQLGDWAEVDQEDDLGFQDIEPKEKDEWDM